MKPLSIVKKATLLLMFGLGLYHLEAQAPVGDRQGPPPPPPPPTAEQRAEHLDHLAKDLDLSEEQKAKVKAVEDQFFEKMEAQRKAEGEKMEALHKEHDDALKGILTEAQFAQFEKIRKEHAMPPRPPRKDKN